MASRSYPVQSVDGGVAWKDGSARFPYTLGRDIAIDNRSIWSIIPLSLLGREFRLGFT